MQEVHGPRVIWVGSVWGIAHAMGYRGMGCGQEKQGWCKFSRQDMNTH